jgi:hypothetical protein
MYIQYVENVTLVISFCCRQKLKEKTTEKRHSQIRRGFWLQNLIVGHS